MNHYQLPVHADVITEDDPLTLDEEYELQRILSLPENLQHLAIEHKQNQFDAMTPYTERFDQRPKNR